MQGDEHGKTVFFVEVAQDLHDRLGRGGVEGSNGLVSQEHTGLLHEGAGNGRALLLAAGKIGGALGRLVEYAHAGEGFLRQLTHLAAVQSRERAPERRTVQGAKADVAKNTHSVDEIELLENDADLRTDAADTAADDAFFLHNMAVDAYAATVSVSGAQAADVADEGGFSGTGRTDEGHHFTGVYAYADVVESPGAGKGLADMVDFNHLIQLLGPRATHALSVTGCIFTGKCYGFVTLLCLFNCEKIAV